MNLSLQFSLGDSTTAIILLVLGAWYLLMSLIAFSTFGYDKHSARKQRPRVPEKTLHLLELLGGFPGAFLAITLFRHKSSKPSFLLISALCSGLNLGLVVILLYTMSRLEVDLSIS